MAQTNIGSLIFANQRMMVVDVDIAAFTPEAIKTLEDNDWLITFMDKVNDEHVYGLTTILEEIATSYSPGELNHLKNELTPIIAAIQEFHPNANYFRIVKS